MGNDFTVEARTSVYDTEKGMYVPFDISSAEDVAISIVGLYRRITGGDVKVTPSGVSASFPGTVPVGRYGVEILFRDSEGKGRVFERNLFEVVGSSGEATLESSAEGETGDGLNITVDVRTRTVRIGGTGATDYPSLTGKPSINGVVLDGDKTAEELGIAPSHIITSETLEVLMAIATSLKQAGEIEIPEDSFRKLEALPEVAFVSLYGGNTALLGAGPIVKGKVDTFTVITGLSCLSPDKCSDFAYTAVDGKYIACRFVGSVPKSISLDANADGTMTSSLPLEQALGTSGGYSFPAFIVRLKNNSRYYRYYPARDIQVVTQEYGDIPTRAYLSINGVYYKWEEDILTPIMSTIGKTPVIYDLRLEAPGGNLTIDDNGFGNSIIIDEIDFKARNPDKSTLIVRVSTYDKRSILFTSFKQGSDGVITSVSLYGYDPEDGRVNGAVLSITPDKTISLKEELAYIPSGETYTKVDADGRFETKVQAAADLEMKADKADVEPYDLSWLVSYRPGVALPDEKVEELMGVLNNHQLVFIRVGEDNDFEDLLLQGFWFKQDKKNILVFSNINSVSAPSIYSIIIDNYTLGDSTWSVVKENYIELLSRSSLKTLNGQSLIGAGDIAIKTQSELEPLYIRVTSASSKTLNYTAKEIYDAIEAGKLLILKPNSAGNFPQPVVHIDHSYRNNKYYIHLIVFAVLGDISTDTEPAILWDLYIGEAAASSYNYTSISYYRWKWPDITSIANKQDKLISGTNIKTINGVSVLGAGDIKTPAPTKVSELENDEGYVKADALETITDASEISVTCESGRIRQGNNIMTLAIGCSATDDSQAVEERMIFSTGSSVEGITVTGVSWANGDTPSFKANKVYEISVSYVPLLGKFLATYAEY